MVHPENAPERAMLMSGAFADALAHTRLASYGEL